MADHDLSYKHLFSHHEMVRDLLEGFVRPDWIAQLDLRSLDKGNASYVSDKLRFRDGDIVWSVPLAEGRVSLHVLLEFQSTVDPVMAVRMISYAGLLYQDMLKSGSVSRGGALPPVLPIVLYNGRKEWHAPQNSSALIQQVPAGLEPYQPQMHYLLIDVARYPDEELARMRNLVAALFRLENSGTSHDVDEIIRGLNEWWGNREHSEVRIEFIAWLRRVIIPRHSRGQSAPVHILEELNMPLAEAVEDWRAKYRGEGQLNGERQILGRLLRKRFGELPPAITQRLQQAQLEELERWSERLLDAGSLAELFDGNTVEA
jgi:hypothetical protein